MGAPEPADLALDPTLLVGPVDPGEAEERVEPVVGAQRGEPFGLGPVTPLEHPGDRGLQVVVAHQGRDPAEVVEPQDVALEERFLGLGGERDVERPTRGRQAQHEHPALDLRPGDHRPELPEVDLALRAGQMRLGNRDLDTGQTQLDAPPPDIPRDRDLGQHRPMLGDQPLPDPPSSVTLLARRTQVSDQPGVDHPRPRIDRRARPPRIGLARRRQRRVQRLAHRAPMHPVTLRQLPDRELLDPPIPPDLLEQLHIAPVRAVYVSLPPRTRDKAPWEHLAAAVGATTVGTQRQLQDGVQAQLATQDTMLVVDEAQNVGLDALKALRWLTGQLTCPFGMILAGVDLNRALGKEPMLASRVSVRLLLKGHRFSELLPQLRAFHPALTEAADADAALLARIDGIYAHGSWRAWSQVLEQLDALGYTRLTPEAAGDAIHLITGSRPW